MKLTCQLCKRVWWKYLFHGVRNLEEARIVCMIYSMAWFTINMKIRKKTHHSTCQTLKCRIHAGFLHSKFNVDWNSASITKLNGQLWAVIIYASLVKKHVSCAMPCLLWQQCMIRLEIAGAVMRSRFCDSVPRNQQDFEAICPTWTMHFMHVVGKPITWFKDFLTVGGSWNATRRWQRELKSLAIQCHIVASSANNSA